MNRRQKKSLYNLFLGLRIHKFRVYCFAETKSRLDKYNCLCEGKIVLLEFQLKATCSYFLCCTLAVIYWQLVLPSERILGELVRSIFLIIFHKTRRSGLLRNIENSFATVKKQNTLNDSLSIC